MAGICSFVQITALALVLFWLASAPVQAADTHWIRVSSGHFWVFTDAGDKRGREAALRLEQMRAAFAELLLKTRLNVPDPVEIFALASGQEYEQTAPTRAGVPAAGVFLGGEDRNFVVLNLSVDEPWRAVAHDLAATLLSYNYPPTQPWFDEGFADYFASIRLSDTQVRLGDPAQPMIDLLNSQTWLPISDLFGTKASAEPLTPLFHAESWIVMHYLLGKNKLTETGTYFELVQNRNVPVAQAIEQAYGVSAAQFEQTVKDHLHSLSGPVPTGAQPANPAGVEVIPTPVPAENFPATTTAVLDTEASAMLAEIRLRIPERRQQAVQELQGMVKEAAASQVSTDNSVIHRALAWSEMESKDYSSAMEELSAAMDLDPKDQWVRYYLALVKYRVGESNGGAYPGLANMMQDLRIVLDWYPEFAEGYNMLGMARLQGGGANSAMEAIRAAMQLSPRNQTYLLNMARAYMAGKKWEAATEMLTRLINNPNPQIAASARRNLEDIPYLKKYGILPQHPEDAQPAKAVIEPSRPSASQRAAAAAKSGAATAGESDEAEEQTPQTPGPDKRPIKFLKGKLVTVDCSQSPVAVVSFMVSAKTLRLRTEDYKSLLLIGPDQFSCDWKNRPAEVNYRVGGKADGDLVSLELQ